MRVDRHQARILAIQCLAQLEVQGESFLDQVDAFLSEAEVGEGTRAHASALARRAWADRASLDERIASVAEHWKLNRMSPVERNVSRVALLELQTGDVPPKVAINEAIEISREYGSADSARFVNGLLDAIHGQLRKDKD